MQQTMDSLKSNQLKAKRVRCNPARKWTVAEEKALIDFFMANRDFEKPTAQAYYRRFSEEAKITVEWKLAHSKVRNMRTSYNRAKGWEGSTGAGSMEGETIRTTLLKMCTFFYELEDIFGTRLVETACIEESLDFHTSSEISNLTEVDVEETTMSASLAVDCGTPASTSRKGIYFRTALSDIMQVQSEMMELKKQKVDQDLKIREQELKIKENELAMKERKMVLKEKEVNSNEKLKIMELEMKERLAMEELKLKYK